MHNASKVLMGSNLSSAKEISTFNSDPATYKAGLCVPWPLMGASAY